MQGLRLLAGIAAAVALALALGAHVASIMTVDVETAYPQVWWLHVTSMVLCGAALLFAMRLAGPKPRLRDLAATVPVWAIAAIAVAFIYVIANFFLLVPLTSAGDPVLKDGRYFFNDHGTIREVSEGAFHAQRAASLRLYSGVWVYLCAIAAALFLLARKPAIKSR